MEQPEACDWTDLTARPVELGTAAGRLPSPLDCPELAPQRCGGDLLAAQPRKVNSLINAEPEQHANLTPSPSGRRRSSGLVSESESPTNHAKCSPTAKCGWDC